MLKTPRRPLCLLSVDDRVDWEFLKLILLDVGLGDNLLHKIMALYSCPSARVWTNGCLSDSFLISNGTRQSCPLSPILYILCMEHLAVALRNNPDIHGIRIADSARSHKIALYADDLLIYVMDPLTSLPTLLLH